MITFRSVRVSLAVLPLLLDFALPPVARGASIQEPGDRSFLSGFELFYSGPEWFLHALPGSRRMATRYLDRSGDVVQAARPDGGIAETSRDLFDLNLFGDIAFFVTASAGQPAAPTVVPAGTVYTWSSATTATSWLNAANWTGNPGFFPGVDANASSTADGAADDIAAIGVTSSGNGGIIGINFGNSSSTGVTTATGASGSLTVGAIDLLATANQSVIIGGSNTATGTLTLTGGTLNGIANTIIANESSSQTLTLQPTASGSGVMNLALGNAVNNVIQVNGAGGIIISAAISGPSRNLTKTGAGILTLSGANTYTGATTVAAGELILTPSGSLSTSSTIRLGDTSINSPSAQFRFGDTTGGETIANTMIVQASASGTEGTRTLLAMGTNGNTNTWTGNVTLNTDLVVQSAAVGGGPANGQGILLFTSGVIDVLNNNFRMDSNLNGNGADTYAIQGIVRVDGVLGSSLPTGGSVIKDGSGTLILGGLINNYTGTNPNTLNPNGTIIRGGVLGIVGDSSLGLAPANPFGEDNVFFQSSAFTTNVDSIAPTLRAEADGIVLASTRNLHIASGVTAQLDSNGYTFTVDGSINGPGSLRKTGAGTLVLSSGNFYSGTTTVSAGTLNAASNFALGGTSNITVNNGGTLMLSGSGNLNRVNDTTPIVLGAGTGPNPIFANGGSASEGTGASRNGLTLTGSSSTGLGALSLQSNATFDFGTGGVGTFTFAGFTANGNTLDILNWTSSATFAGQVSGVDGQHDRLIFAGAPTDIGFITFNGTMPAGFILLEPGYYEVVPVPEPGTWISAALALMAVGFTQRRRLRGLLAPRA